MPESRVKTLTICVSPHERLNTEGMVFVEDGLKSPVKQTKASGYFSKKQSIVSWTWLYKMLLSSAVACGGWYTTPSNIVDTDRGRRKGLTWSHIHSDTEFVSSMLDKRTHGMLARTKAAIPPPREPRSLRKRLKSWIDSRTRSFVLARPRLRDTGNHPHSCCSKHTQAHRF